MVELRDYVPVPTAVCSSSMKRMMGFLDAEISEMMLFNRVSSSPRSLAPASSMAMSRDSTLASCIMTMNLLCMLVVAPLSANRRGRKVSIYDSNQHLWTCAQLANTHMQTMHRAVPLAPGVLMTLSKWY